MKTLFRAKGCIIRTIDEGDLQKTLEVYQQVEDFLSLGPVPKASMEMVLADMEHSKQSGGFFCVIHDRTGDQIGVLDFVPERTEGIAFLSLLMISQRARHQGNGRAIVGKLESYLRRKYGTQTIESGVQTNNDQGIGFWKHCGFEIGQTPKALGDGTAAYEMKKTLVPILR